MDNKWTDYFFIQAFPDVQDFSQKGYGFPTIYRGPVLQRGYGIGDIFKSMSRTVMPALKEGLKTIGKSALQTGLDVLQDVSRGENLKTAAKNRLKQNSMGLLNESLLGIKSRKPINNKQRKGKAISSKRVKKRKQRKDKTNSDSEDIFTNFAKIRKI